MFRVKVRILTKPGEAEAAGAEVGGAQVTHGGEGRRRTCGGETNTPVSQRARTSKWEGYALSSGQRVDHRGVRV